MPHQLDHGIERQPRRSEEYNTLEEDHAQSVSGKPESFARNVLAFAAQPPALGFHLATVALLGIIAVLCVRMGVPPVRGYPHDMMFLADNGWRVLWGQRPHADYSSGWGPVSFLLSAGGFRLSHGSIDGIGWTYAIVALGIAAWSYAILLRRLSGFFAATGAVMLALLAIAPSVLGESFRLTSTAMYYNRYGFALLGILMAEGFPLRPGTRERGFSDGFSTGAICAILLFLKANFFLVSAIMIPASMLWPGRIERRRIAGVAAGFAACALPLLFYLRFDLVSMFADLRMAASARGALVSPAFAAQIFAENSPVLVIALALAAVLLPGVKGSGFAALFARYRWCWFILMAYCGAVALLVTNCQFERLPLMEIAVLLLLDSLLFQAERFGLRQTLVLSAIGAALLVTPLATDGLSLLNGLRMKWKPPGQYASRVTSGAFAPAIYLDDYREDKGTPQAYGAYMAAYLEDGMGLLRRQRSPGEKVATFDCYNPFPFALGVEPPRGGMGDAFYNFVFDDRHHISPERFFGDADLVMYPLRSILPGPPFAGLEKFYRPELERRFAPVAESKQWRLYRRR